MSLSFVAMAALLTAAALLFVLTPLLRRDRAPAPRSRSAANAALLRDERASLEAERKAGRISDEQYGEEMLELERRALEDASPDDDSPGAAPAHGRPAAVAVLVLVPLTAALVYWATGNPYAIEAARAGSRQAHPVSPQQVSAMVDRLAERLKSAPGNVAGWATLARSLAMLGRYEESAQAYAQLAGLVPGDAGVLADYADTLAMAQGRSLAGAPAGLVMRALELDPHHVKALALAGSSEFERGDYAKAVGYWERILERVPRESDFGRSVQASIAQARSAAAR